MDRGTCLKGVPGSRFPDDRLGSKPCFLAPDGESYPNALPCEHLRRPTPEEIDAYERWRIEQRRRLYLVMRGIESWRDAHEGKTVSEIVACPVCGGRLHLNIAGGNASVEGRCETEGCVAWIE